MGTGFLVQRGGSGGAGINFKVIGGTTKPENPKENMIWVNTDKINNYYFSATQPENMVDYDVWILTGTDSAVEFNALRKNGIQVYPISAKQYVSGVLVNKNVKSYQNGKWVGWITYLFKSGEGAKIPFVKANASNASITVDATKITGVASQPSSSEWIYLSEDKVSVLGRSEVVMVAKCTFANGGTEWGPRLVLFERIPSLGYSPIQQGITIYGSAFMTADGITKEYIIPVTGLDGEYIIGYHGIGSVEIYDIFVR